MEKIVNEIKKIENSIKDGQTESGVCEYCKNMINDNDINYGKYLYNKKINRKQLHKEVVFCCLLLLRLNSPGATILELLWHAKCIY